jgi:hypothetical protein
VQASVGFDGDVGSDTDEHEGVDACHAENGVECGVFEPVGRLPLTNSTHIAMSDH